MLIRQILLTELSEHKQYSLNLHFPVLPESLEFAHVMEILENPANRSHICMQKWFESSVLIFLNKNATPEECRKINQQLLKMCFLYMKMDYRRRSICLPNAHKWIISSDNHCICTIDQITSKFTAMCFSLTVVSSSTQNLYFVQRRDTPAFYLMLFGS